MKDVGTRQSSPSKPSPAKAPTATRVAAAVVGGAALVAGGFSVYQTENGSGTAALLGVGAVLLLVAAFFERIESLEFGGAKVVLRDAAIRAAARLEDLAADLEDRGEEQAAQDLRQEAQAVLQIVHAARPVASSYEAVRATKPPSLERTRELEGLIAKARRDAAETTFTTNQVRELFETGAPGNRIYALGLMEGRRDLRAFDLALAAIENSKSAFEQYHALVLAELMLPDLSKDEREQLVGALVHQTGPDGWIKPGTDRWRLSERLQLAIVSERSTVPKKR